MSLETHRINSTCFFKLLAAGRLIAGAGVVDAESLKDLWRQSRDKLGHVLLGFNVFLVRPCSTLVKSFSSLWISLSS